MGCRDFWNNKYQRNSDNAFDWFFKSEEIVDYLQKIISENMTVDTKKAAHVLDLGCGTSLMPVVLYQELSKISSPTVLHCLDFALNAVSFQKRTFLKNEIYCYNNSRNKRSTDATEESDNNVVDKTRHKVYFVVGDALRLPYARNFFDIIVDKGTVDSILRSTNTDRLTKAQALIQQAVECLSQDGILLQISDEDPDSRLSLIEDSVKTGTSMLSITHIKLNTDTGYDYFMYFIKK